MPRAPYVYWGVELKHILGSLHLKDLSILHLANFQAEADNLAQCLLHHKETLEDLTLKNVHLSEDDWPAYITGFAGKLPRLRHARINGPLTSEDPKDEGSIVFYIPPWGKNTEREDEMERFILQGDGQVPSWTDDSGTEGEEHFTGEDDGSEDEGSSADDREPEADASISIGSEDHELESDEMSDTDDEDMSLPTPEQVAEWSRQYNESGGNLAAFFSAGASSNP